MGLSFPFPNFFLGTVARYFWSTAIRCDRRLKIWTESLRAVNFSFISSTSGWQRNRLQRGPMPGTALQWPGHAIGGCGDGAPGAWSDWWTTTSDSPLWGKEQMNATCLVTWAFWIPSCLVPCPKNLRPPCFLQSGGSSTGEKHGLKRAGFGDYLLQQFSRWSDHCWGSPESASSGRRRWARVAELLRHRIPKIF